MNLSEVQGGSWGAPERTLNHGVQEGRTSLL